VAHHHRGRVVALVARIARRAIERATSTPGAPLIGDADELATFFSIERTMVDRALRFLETIGHLRRAGCAVILTDLGAQSVRDGCR
jgi:hypothetical protein